MDLSALPDLSPMNFVEESGSLKVMKKDARTAVQNFPHDGKVSGIAITGARDTLYFATKSENDGLCRLYAEKINMDHFL